jgi:hypothetical protein
VSKLHKKGDMEGGIGFHVSNSLNFFSILITFAMINIFEFISSNEK